LAGEVRGGGPLETAPHDLKPNADDDICGQLHVFYAQSSLGHRFGKIRLEIFANPAAFPFASMIEVSLLRVCHSTFLTVPLVRLACARRRV
jgi:hypothetical protein